MKIAVWGQFGLDLSVGSCTIILDSQGRSSKEFLFVFAFLSPCLAIIVCYARWVEQHSELSSMMEYCIHSFCRIFFIAHQAAQKSAEKKEVAKPHEDAKLLQVISLRCRPQHAAKLAFKLTKLIHRFCQIFLLGLWPLEKEIDT